MQIKTITVNKSDKNTDGVKIDVVVPSADVEIELVSFLLAGFIRDAASTGKFKVELPDQYRITYQYEGSFLITTEPGVAAAAKGNASPYYTPPKPIAVVAIQRHGKRYDLAYAAINQEAFKTQKPADAKKVTGKKAVTKKAAPKK